MEREIAQDLRSSGLDPRATRMPLSGATDGLKSDISTSLPISLEVKNQETWKPLEYYEQAVRDCRPGKMPIVVMSKNREKKYAFLLWEDLIQLMLLAKETGFWASEAPYSKRKQVGR